MSKMTFTDRQIDAGIVAWGKERAKGLTLDEAMRAALTAAAEAAPKSERGIAEGMERAATLILDQEYRGTASWALREILAGTIRAAAPQPRDPEDKDTP